MTVTLPTDLYEHAKMDSKVSIVKFLLPAAVFNLVAGYTAIFEQARHYTPLTVDGNVLNVSVYAVLLCVCAVSALYAVKGLIGMREHAKSLSHLFISGDRGEC
jgi:hypothetical protein